MSGRIAHVICVILVLAVAVVVVSPSAYCIEFTISGQINRAVLYADDGDQSEVFFVDNTNSSTRFRFLGTNDFDNGWRVGFLWEVEMKSNPSNQVNMDLEGDLPGPTFQERHIDILFQKWGILRLGQGDTATNGTAEVDLSGTDVATFSSVSDVGGGFEFKKDGAGTGVTVGQTRSNFDGLSRRDRIRYDTPRFAGMFVAIAAEQKGEWDVAARYAADFGWARLAAAAGWAEYESSADSAGGTRTGGLSSSASMLFKNGLNLTVSYAFRDQIGPDPTNLYGKIGYRSGKHAASIQYSRTKDLAEIGDKGDTFGLAYVHSTWEGVELYGTYYLHMLKRETLVDPDDINVFMAGARVKF